MHKHALIILLAAGGMMSTGNALAQKMITSTSEVHFFSDALLEDISATTTEAKGLLNEETGDFFFRIQMTSFHFENELMEEHFNENYMESEKYPLATFKGTLDPKLLTNLKTQTTLQATGTLTIHGKEQKRTIPVIITPVKNELEIQSSFDVALVDHDIEIPTIVFQKIAEVIAVTVKAKLIPLKS